MSDGGPINPPGETPDVGVPAELAAHMTVPEQHEWVTRFLRERPVSRRSALTLAAGALTALGAGAVLAEWGGRAVGSTPPPFVGRRLSFGNDPRTQMALAVELTQPPRDGLVLDLGVDHTYGRALPVEIRHLLSSVPQNDGTIRAAEQWYVHALAEGLEPGRAYHYRFRMPGGAVTPNAVFHTAPAGREQFSFTAFGDQGVDEIEGVPHWFSNRYKYADTRRAANPALTLTRMVAARKPAFHLLAGDICYPGSDGRPVRNNAPTNPLRGFDNYDPTIWTRYFATIGRSAATTPWMFATGNHEVEALYDDNTSGGATHGYGGHAARLDLPTNGPRGCPSVYSFRYGNVGFVSMDTNDLTHESRATVGYSQGAQPAWLRGTLYQLRADPQIDFIVVFFHHCAYSTAIGHGSDDGVRSQVAPMFDEFSVDLAVQAHNHCWERTDPIRGGHPTVTAPNGSTVRPATDGTTYICAGSGGRGRSAWPMGITDRYPGLVGVDSGTEVTSTLRLVGAATVPETVGWSRARYSGYAMLAVDVVPGAPGFESTMTVRTISDRGERLDTVTLVRRASS
ncbi:MAG TPA: metallophosphoesterase [Sporichthyaceae bacterium]|jgi:hypothetical protein